jgi:hypothetical protein
MIQYHIDVECFSVGGQNFMDDLCLPCWQICEAKEQVGRWRLMCAYCLLLTGGTLPPPGCPETEEDVPGCADC